MPQYPSPALHNFSHISPPRFRETLERIDNYRVNDQLDKAIQELENVNANIKYNFYAIGAAPLIIVLCILGYQNYAKDDKQFEFASALLALLVASLARIQLQKPLISMLKETNTFLSYLHKEQVLITIDKIQQEQAPDPMGVLLAIQSHLEKQIRFYKRAIGWAGHAGINANDLLLLHLSIKGALVKSTNLNTGLDPVVLRLLSVGVNPNLTPPSLLEENETLIWTYASCRNWRAIDQLLDMFPQLDVSTCPQSGLFAGYSVLTFAAISNKWSLFERLIRDFNPNLNETVKGPGNMLETSRIGKPIMWFVAQAGKSDVVQRLINLGATVTPDCLSAIISKCDPATLRLLIEKDLFTKKQIWEASEKCDFSIPLLCAIVAIDGWAELKQIIYNENYVIDNDLWIKLAEAFKTEGDTRFTNLNSFAQSARGKSIIKNRLKQEVDDNPIIQAALKYDSDIIKKYMSLDATTLKEMFDPITLRAVIIDPVRIVLRNLKLPTFYERKELQNWIMAQELQDREHGALLPGLAAHPEIGAGTKIELANVVAANLEEKSLIVTRMDEMMQKLEKDAKPKRKVNLRG